MSESVMGKDLRTQTVGMKTGLTVKYRRASPIHVEKDEGKLSGEHTALRKVTL